MLALRDYQLDAVDRLHDGAILCGGVGSGKSVTALTYYFEQCGGSMRDGTYHRMTEAKPLTIITTARKRDTREWEKELRHFLLSPGVPKESSPYPMDVTIDSWNNIKKYAELTGGFFIFDEQRVVGKGAWVKSFLKIAKRNRWILLSATPGDCWSDYIPVFIANGFYANRTEFLRRHAVFSRFSKYPKIDRYVDCGRLAALRRRVMVDMDFKRPTEAHHITVVCDYDRELTRQVMRTRFNPFTNEPIREAGEMCQVLRRIANTDASHVELLNKTIDNHSAIVIFYNYDYELEQLRKLLTDRGYPFAEWNGHKHEPIPDGNKWAYLVQYNAGAEGWNCTRTDTIVFYSQNYSYRIMVQAAGRIDRMNTPFKDLYYYHFRTSSPIDLAVQRALNTKRDFNESRFLSRF